MRGPSLLECCSRGARSIATLTLHSSIVRLLRSSGVPRFTWGQDGSPYYDEVPEPPPAFPYVVFEVPESSVESTYEAVYAENYAPVFHVVGTEANIETVASPYGNESVVAFLDAQSRDPHVFSGDNFDCEMFVRRNWTLRREPLRASDGARVWIASATYDAIVVSGGLLEGRR